MLNGTVFDFDFFLYLIQDPHSTKMKYPTLFVSVRKKVLTKPSKTYFDDY